MAAPEPARTRLSARLARVIVAEFRGIAPDDLTGPRRDRLIAWPRQEACWILRQRTGMSLPLIGQQMGGRDHTTIMHGLNAVAQRRRDDTLYRAQTDTLLALVDREISQPEAEAVAPQTVRCLARHLIADPLAASRDDVARLAAGILSVAAILANPALADAEARLAGREILSSPVGPDTETL